MGCKTIAILYTPFGPPTSFSSLQQLENFDEEISFCFIIIENICRLLFLLITKNGGKEVNALQLFMNWCSTILKVKMYKVFFFDIIGNNCVELFSKLFHRSLKEQDLQHEPFNQVQGGLKNYGIPIMN